MDHFKSSVSQERKKKKRKREEEDVEDEDDGGFPLFLHKQKETDSALRKRKATELLPSLTSVHSTLSATEAGEEGNLQPRKKKPKKSKERVRLVSFGFQLYWLVIC